MLADEAEGETGGGVVGEGHRGITVVVCTPSPCIVWPEWKKGAPYFASAFSLLAVCNDVPRAGERRRAGGERISPVQCRAFRSLSFHDERPRHRLRVLFRAFHENTGRKRGRGKWGSPSTDNASG